MSRALIAFMALVTLLAVPAAHAQERILEYGADLQVMRDGSIEIDETIKVRAEGDQIRRGITRSFPTRYRDRFGNRVVVGFDLLGVQRDGKHEPSFVESASNGVIVNTGDDDFLPVPDEFTYTLRYRTTRQLGFFDGFDELYYNAIPPESIFPVEDAWVRVHLPADVAPGDLQLTAYSGPQGTQGRDWKAAVEGPRTVRFEATRTLMPYEGLTVVVGFPKGLVIEPDASQKATWFLRDNAGVLVGLLSLFVLLAFYAWRWHLVGRDPQAGPVFPRYDPPADLAPGEVRMLHRMGYDTRAFAADVVDMAVRGYLKIHSGRGDWRLTRKPDADSATLAPGQQALAARLFAGGEDEVELKDTEATRVGGARSAHHAAMLKRLSPTYYVSNRGSLVAGVLLSALAGVLALVVSGGNGIPVLFVLGMIVVVVHLFFARLLRAPTPEGRKRMDEIEGLKKYLSVAERDEIKGMAMPGHDAAGAPPLDAGRYEALLPYAMALDVESAWTDKFTAAVGVREAEGGTPTWYDGVSQSRMGLAGLGSSLGTTLTSQIASASTPPGSSSGGSGGGGGGGFSGGGGGGGGVGGR